MAQAGQCRQLKPHSLNKPMASSGSSKLINFKVNELNFFKIFISENLFSIKPVT